MSLDQSVKPFTLLIGNFDVTDYLVAFTISTPNSEINQTLYWSGTFELKMTDQAYLRGLTPDAFSEIANPIRWRKGKSTVTLTINGDVFPPLLISDYVFENNSAKGSLTQVTDLISFSRESKEIEGTAFTYGQPLTDVVNALLLEAGKVTTNAHGTVTVLDQSKIFVSPLQGELTVKLTSDNPIETAQNLTATNWRWIAADLQGNLRTIERPEYGMPLFRRASTQVNVLPLTDNIHFAADRVVVTGSRELAKAPELNTDEPENDNDDFDSRGRQKKVRTETIEPIGSIFVDLKPGDATPYTTEAKTVFYRYAGDLTSAFNPNAYINLSGEANYEANQYPIAPAFGDDSETVQTITVSEIIIGKLFKDDLPPANTVPSLPTSPTLTNPTLGTRSPASKNIPLKLLGFIIGNITIETPSKKISFVPYGVKFPEADVNLDRKIRLTLERSETLRSPLVISGSFPAVKDPLTGKAIRLEDRPKLEDPQIAPEIDYETEAIKAEYNLTPNGYNTFLPQTYPIDFGFLPNQESAATLARKVALREFGRRDAKQIFMEIPREWSSTGYPFFTIADIGSVRVLIENPIIALSKGRMIFSFTGEKLGDIDPVMPPEPIMPYIPVDGLNLVTTGNIAVMVGQSVRLQLIALNGQPPYSFSATGLPANLLIDSSTGIINGIATEANI